MTQLVRVRMPVEAGGRGVVKRITAKLRGGVEARTIRQARDRRTMRSARKGWRRDRRKSIDSLPRRGVRDAIEGFVAVFAMVDVETVLRQGGVHLTGEIHVVFHEEEPHVPGRSEPIVPPQWGRQLVLHNTTCSRNQRIA